MPMKWRAANRRFLVSGGRLERCGRTMEEEGKRVGAYKITHILERDYGIKISLGRVYRLIKALK